MHEELSFGELDGERVDLLPARETLYWNANWANVWASNSSMALNAASYLSNAQSMANQAISVYQS